jgi:hypothetical protein
MSFGLTFIQTFTFVAEFHQLRLTDEDLQALESILLRKPDAGKVMPRTGGVRKLRFAPPSQSRGKRGACRVCYAWFPAQCAIGLFLIYPKSQKDTLTADDEAVCRTLVSRMNKALKGA